MEAKLPTVKNAADTHINACAVLSQLGRHQTALEHAQQALILLQEELLSPPGASGTDAKATPQADRIAVLAIAYHNVGVEQEFLKKYENSVMSYRKGVEIAERYLGPKHAICITLKNSLVATKKAIAASSKNAARAQNNTTNASSSQKVKTKKVEKGPESPDASPTLPPINK